MFSLAHTIQNRIISEKWILKDVEVALVDYFRYLYCFSICLEERRNPLITSEELRSEPDLNLQFTGTE
jgi:hypothetical protein